jgi:hypothetical protein
MVARAFVTPGERRVSTFRMASLTTEGAKMEFTALFLSAVVVVGASWWGSRQLALALFTVALIAAVATYFHHATDVLKLSF